MKYSVKKWNQENGQEKKSNGEGFSKKNNYNLKSSIQSLLQFSKANELFVVLKLFNRLQRFLFCVGCKF